MTVIDRIEAMLPDVTPEGWRSQIAAHTLDGGLFITFLRPDGHGGDVSFDWIGREPTDDELRRGLLRRVDSIREL